MTEQPDSYTHPDRNPAPEGIVLRSHSGTVRRVEADHLVSKWHGEN